MKNTQQATDTLLSAPPAMRETACYETQLGNLEEGMRSRETEEMRQDVITKSKSLRLKFPLKRPDDKPQVVYYHGL